MGEGDTLSVYDYRTSKGKVQDISILGEIRHIWHEFGMDHQI